MRLHTKKDIVYSRDLEGTKKTVWVIKCLSYWDIRKAKLIVGVLKSFPFFSILKVN